MRRSIIAVGVLLTAATACSQAASDDSQAAAAPKASAATPPSSVSTSLTIDSSEEVNPRLLRRFQPLPKSLGRDNSPASPAEIGLGKQLFYEARLSKTGTMSCNSCHDLASYGVDHTRTSKGGEGVFGRRNAPTVYNAAGEFVQFWDGRAPDVEGQAKGPILNPIEMGMPSAAAVVKVLRGIPGYVTAFEAAYPGAADAVTYDNVGRAIGAFERTLVTPGRWDEYLAGNRAALTPAEKKGLKTFLNVGCMVCHTGAFVGGSMFERAGAVEPWPNQDDKGREEVSKTAGDAMMFKVPSLRNVEKTAPYFHDGSVATLEDAVHMMGKHQLGLDLSSEETGAIVTWLKSLTGELPQDALVKPTLP